MLPTEHPSCDHLRVLQKKGTCQERNLEFLERLDGLAGARKDAEDVETDSLAQWSALSDGNLITLLHTESRRHVGRKVLVSLLVTGVLGNEVEVFSADDEGTVHLRGDDRAGQDTATD